MSGEITRRDFLGSTLIGSGTALLTATAPGLLSGTARAATKSGMPSGLGPGWTGPGGIGDYASANGYTAPMVNAGHGLRNSSGPGLPPGTHDTKETYDVVIVGGGFAGLAAAYTLHKERPELSCLVLDNAPIFGGHAKHNEFVVDDYRLWAPQGSQGVVAGPSASLARKSGFLPHFWFDLGLPEAFEYAPLEGTDKPLHVPTDTDTPMQWRIDAADTGFFFDDPGVGSNGWIVNPWSHGLKGVPWPEDLKAELMALQLYTQPPRPKDWERWLDSMTYLDYLTKVIGLSPRAVDYINPIAASTGCGLGADAISAFAAVNYLELGAEPYTRDDRANTLTHKYDLESFPGGNTAIARHFVKALLPEAITGGDSAREILFNSVQWSAFDRPGQKMRMRFGSTVADVRHEPNAEGAETVSVVYRAGQTTAMHQVRARAVVMACAQWVNARIVKDLPAAHLAAMQTIPHAPMLTVNVAVRNWKFLEKLGITAARWFDGFGWFMTVKRPMMIDGRASMPLDPAKPTVITLHIPFPTPGLPAREQAAAANGKLLVLSFADIEKAVRAQFNKMFARSGFDAERDIAGLIANRWGHAWAVFTPGYYFGTNGQPAPRTVIQQPHGRIAFGHSDLSGDQGWDTAVMEGERAMRQVLTHL